MSKYVKVENRKDLVRDINSQAIINVDSEGLKAAKAKKQSADDKNRKLKNQEDRISRLEKELEAIGKMLELVKDKGK